MDVLKELESFNEEIQSAKMVVEELRIKRIDWCRANRKEIKKLYPIKGKIYQIVDPKNALQWGWYGRDKTDDVYYFKANNIRFAPHEDFSSTWGHEKPTALGVVLDCNLNVISSHARIYITYIKEVERENSPKNLSSNFTQVYVMIDKNTGYYKIGRSVNPKKRERTLQSEKPTIEMLFSHDARIKDEKELHIMFDDKRVRGEWFDLNGSDLSRIREYFNGGNE